MNLITGKILRKESEDVIMWSGDSNGVFVFCEICIPDLV